MNRLSVLAVSLTLGAALIQPAAAQTLTAGFASEPSSVDPLYHNLEPNNALRKHIFESIVGEDEALRIVPLLAESWENVDESTWLFHLRKGAKFHDGSDFTARDFLYTACRIPNVPNSPSAWAGVALAG